MRSQRDWLLQGCDHSLALAQRNYAGYKQGSMFTHQRNYAGYKQGSMLTHQRNYAGYKQGSMLTYQRNYEGYKQGSTAATHRSEGVLMASTMASKDPLQSSAPQYCGSNRSSTWTPAGHRGCAGHQGPRLPARQAIVQVSATVSTATHKQGQNKAYAHNWEIYKKYNRHQS